MAAAAETRQTFTRSFLENMQAQSSMLSLDIARLRAVNSSLATISDVVQQDFSMHSVSHRHQLLLNVLRATRQERIAKRLHEEAVNAQRLADKPVDVSMQSEDAACSREDISSTVSGPASSSTLPYIPVPVPMASDLPIPEWRNTTGSSSAEECTQLGKGDVLGGSSVPPPPDRSFAASIPMPRFARLPPKRLDIDAIGEKAARAIWWASTEGAPIVKEIHLSL